MGDVTQYMKRHWDSRAKRDPFRYVETQHWDGNVANFFQLGEERAAVLIDPLVETLMSRTYDKVALDVGCGVGRFSRALASRFGKVIGIDVSQAMIRKAIELHPTQTYRNMVFYVGDGLSYPISDRSIDFVFSYEVFQHMPSYKVMSINLSEIARVLGAEGHALIHFKTSANRFELADFYREHVPDVVDRILKRVLGKDQMTADAAFRGAPPLNQEQIRSRCATAGLEVLRFRDDRTHAPRSRIFAVMRRIPE